MLIEGILVPKGSIRRSQLIAPFGVGALSVTRDGTSVITCGLDHWYERENQQQDPQTLDPAEFTFEERRLQRILDVDFFRLPPDFRIKRINDLTPNCYVTVPFLRFPRWHFCPHCYLLRELPLSHRPKEQCAECFSQRKKRISIVQVPSKREALLRNAVHREDVTKKAAELKVRNFIQNIHHFRDQYAGNHEIPAEKVVVSDEAQRAWTSAQAISFIQRKR